MEPNKSFQDLLNSSSPNNSSNPNHPPSNMSPGFMPPFGGQVYPPYHQYPGQVYPNMFPFGMYSQFSQPPYPFSQVPETQFPNPFSPISSEGEVQTIAPVVETTEVSGRNKASKKGKEKVLSAKTKTRQPWSQEEDVLLAKAFINVSEDSIVGNNQSSKDFWRRIERYFNDGDEAEIFRSGDNLKSHWHMLVQNVTAFNGFMVSLRNQRKSGYSDDQLKNLAYELFRRQNGKNFIHEHVWNVLKDEPKWKRMNPECPPKKKSRTSESGNYSTSSDANNLEDHIPIDDDILEEVAEIPRPMGRNKAISKKKGKGKVSIQEDEKEISVEKIYQDFTREKMEMMNKIQESLSHKNKLQELEILYKDTSNMTPEMLRFHHARCEAIMKKYPNF